MKLQLTTAEQKLIDAARGGQAANFSSGDPAQDDPAKGGVWGDHRTIRAEIIYALATGSCLDWPVHTKGIQVAGAKIEGQLDFGGAEIRCRLAFIRCHIDKPMILADAAARSIALTGSRIGGIQAERLTVRGSVFLDAVATNAEVKFLGAAISGQLKCRGAHFLNLNGPALNADGATIGGGVFLDQGFIARGEVRFVRAQITGELNCRGSLLEALGTPALTADGVTAIGGLFLDQGFDEKGTPVGNPFTARGEVRLLHAEVSGQFSCSGGIFVNPNGYALSADGAIINGQFLMNRDFAATGAVAASGAKISGDLVCSGGKFDALILERAQVVRTLSLDHLKSPAQNKIDLMHARVGQLADEQSSWPTRGNLRVDGFEYDAIAPGAPSEATSRLQWLRLAPEDHLSMQPYEQLEKVLRASGDENGARAVYIEKRRTVRRCGGLGRTARSWDWFLDRSIRYGYQTWRALVWALLIITFGAIPFWNWFWNMQVPLVQTAAIVISTQSGMAAGGIRVETSAIYNLTTQFGGGKTHALTLLYHLAKAGLRAEAWRGVSQILDVAGVKAVPAADVAVFVGTEFSSRGGDDGTPLRRTPWGEIAFQLGGSAGFAAVAQLDEDRTAPSTDLIRKFLPKDRPALILLDELVNYMGRNRKSGLTAQLYYFLQNLCEEARAQENVVLAVSLPSLMDEMTAEDEADFDRFQKLLDRVGKPMIMSAETETSEIIRRRLFEWSGLPDDAKRASAEYADWVTEHRAQIPGWFPVDTAKDAFAATYPFHPTLLSVFERKWQQLPRFQQTRGILRLLALWVSHAYQAGFKGAHKDPLIGMGTAPLDDPIFRSAVIEQLGGAKLEGAITTDICGKKDAHALRLDKEATETIRKARLHQKVATVIFFESNGGQARAEATLPEIRLAVAEPDLDIGNVDTALDALTDSCYFLLADKNRYRFSLFYNLNKVLADRRASIQPARVEERVRAETQKVFDAGPSREVVDRIYFPEKTSQISDRAVLTLVVLKPDQIFSDKATSSFIEAATREHGASARTFKSALIWLVAENPEALRDEARKVLAWEDIADEEDEIRLEDSQKRKLPENIKRAQNALRETVWRTYKNAFLLTKDNQLSREDLGLVTSSAADSLTAFVLNRLAAHIEQKPVSPNFLVRNWPPAFKEWDTESVRDAFFSSPQFPKLLNPDSIKETISRGVENGMLGYIGKQPDGTYKPFYWQASLQAQDIEISDSVFIITGDTAKAYQVAGPTPPTQPTEGPSAGASSSSQTTGAGTTATTKATPGSTARLRWSGEVPPQKWMNFYTKVLSRFATGSGLKLTVSVEVAPTEGISAQKAEETKVALRELGINDDVDTSE